MCNSVLSYWICFQEIDLCSKCLANELCYYVLYTLCIAIVFVCAILFFSFYLARDVFVRMNRRAIAMMFISLSLCPSVCLSGIGMQCDYTL